METAKQAHNKQGSKEARKQESKEEGRREGNIARGQDSETRLKWSRHLRTSQHQNKIQTNTMTNISYVNCVPATTNPIKPNHKT
jgi:hypothetical protein